MNRDPLETTGTKAPRVVAPNVMEFINRAADIYGRLKNDEFSQKHYAIALECGSESPIEDLFWIALDLLCEAHGLRLNPDPEFDGDELIANPPGICALHQHVLGNYRVDYCLTRAFRRLTDSGSEIAFEPPVVVELDGHAFHDKDKHQRSYEKARDRYLVKQGYRVLHFTGSDVVRDPFKVAFEVLHLLNATYDDSYDPNNPTGLE